MIGASVTLALVVALADGAPLSSTTGPSSSAPSSNAPSSNAPSSNAPSSTSAVPADDLPIHDPRGCPSLFGDDDARARIRRFRESAVGEVSIQNNIVTVVHSVSAWRDVTVHRRQGLSVSSIERVRVTAPDGSVSEEVVALVDVTERAFPKGHACTSGLYALSPDDTIGERGFVLLVDTRGVLVELDGQLGWLSWPGQRVPRSRVVWRSSFDASVDEKLLAKRATKTPLALRTYRRL